MYSKEVYMYMLMFEAQHISYCSKALVMENDQILVFAKTDTHSSQSGQRQI